MAGTEEEARVLEEAWQQLGRRQENNNLRMMLEASDQVQAHIDETLGDRVDALYGLAGMIPNATARLINEIPPPPTARDECALFHASRICGHVVSAFTLLRKSLIVDATAAVRNTTETVAQAVLLLRRPDLAEAWMQGRQFKPAEVRNKLGAEGEKFRRVYSELSAIAHANPDARWSHSVAASGGGYAISLGSQYQPKSAARLLALLGDLLIYYLTAFYDSYKGTLSVQYWPVVIKVWSTANDEAVRAWAGTLPDDRVFLSEYVADKIPAAWEDPVPEEWRARVITVAESLRQKLAPDLTSK